MKIRPSNYARSRGSAVIVVLVLLFMMALLLSANSLALRRFKQSLRSIEHRELRQYRVADRG
jgi:type II secretory pathway component PulK